MAQNAQPETRTEQDSFGPIAVPADRYWGAQTQRSVELFRIGEERMPASLVRALGVQKKAAALANLERWGATMAARPGVERGMKVGVIAQ